MAGRRKNKDQINILIINHNITHHKFSMYICQNLSNHTSYIYIIHRASLIPMKCFFLQCLQVQKEDLLFYPEYVPSPVATISANGTTQLLKSKTQTMNLVRSSPPHVILLILCLKSIHFSLFTEPSLCACSSPPLVPSLHSCCSIILSCLSRCSQKI